ncbi:hypothetical protein FIBSPDRAFT_920660 [Athelia psychrophila]|uniref:N6-adenine methyltransferase n=1 Tax=Athelia psychrophila TaxID=1759441 RepID=A0A166G5Z0_9AGAM|nr:hypothetical protein FIBSPDRAFT_920660 [Fibularhizoctonia sp. CBS 109695]
MAMPFGILINEHRDSSGSSSSTPRSDSPELQLGPSTIAMLDRFFAGKAEEQRLFEHFEAQALQLEGVYDDPDAAAGSIKSGISVDDFRTAFVEDWQLSQFWYTTLFAHRLADAIHAIVPAPTEDSNIAYICCPTGYIAYQNTHQSAKTLLLEYDQRFAIAAASSGGGHFVHYNLEEDNIPKTIKGTVELAIIDPPFLNELTNRHLARALKQLLHPTKGKLVLITSTSVACLSEVYGKVPQLGALRMTKLQPEHTGLRNDFACWTTWEGGENFGAEG